ncbi:MAG: 50S ribosomal protein L5 [Planctomycetota bacterium]|jgi:large subunit ribosomal protein L5|nr:50S ribosomal protein L5 [Planctomycetota bacterium]HAQ67329.1 50S ribosomal protein L5 [Phycisphaerales bacterium]RLS23341.1 MAG: 50S ribosomal protein L5 [Planctomycetota bacterium]RLS49944.1 MAG: 50S ribosomal protein L5 [Planctomycetota bacterium]RLS52073.1 MAG: 50S ribosomal protein L5 [Planctomycetota bacterium]
MTTTATKSRLHTMYMEQVAPKLMKEFGLTNINQVPVIEKVIVNTGVGKQLENQKLKPEIRDTVYDTYRKITGQKAVMTIAKKSVSNFKVREGAPSGFMVTLRRDKMWSFLDRLMNLAIPRIKDFRGVSDRSFDKGGSWSFGLSEQAVWPEINMASVTFFHGMNITIVFRNSDPKMSRFALAELGMPFEKPEDRKKK